MSAEGDSTRRSGWPPGQPPAASTRVSHGGDSPAPPAVATCSSLKHALTAGGSGLIASTGTKEWGGPCVANVICGGDDEGRLLTVRTRDAGQTRWNASGGHPSWRTAWRPKDRRWISTAAEREGRRTERRAHPVSQADGRCVAPTVGLARGPVARFVGRGRVATLPTVRTMVPAETDPMAYILLRRQTPRLPARPLSFRPDTSYMSYCSVVLLSYIMR